MRNVRLMVWLGETVQVECYRCVSGKWQTASGDGLKGIFITITDQTSGYKCVIPNSDTGAHVPVRGRCMTQGMVFIWNTYCGI